VNCRHSVGKKAGFIRQPVASLNLTNVLLVKHIRV